MALRFKAHYSTMIPLEHILYFSAFLFCLGLLIILSKRNMIVVLMGIELLFNAANINLVAFSRYDPELLSGQVFALFVVVIAAAEAALGLAIIIQVYKYYKTSNLDKINKMGG